MLASRLSISEIEGQPQPARLWNPCGSWLSISEIEGQPQQPVATEAEAAWLSISEIEGQPQLDGRSEEHTSELQSLMRISYAVFRLKKKTKQTPQRTDRPMTQVYATI